MTASPPRLRVLAVITHLSLGGAENVALSLAEELIDEVEFEFFVVLETARKTAISEAMTSRFDKLSIPLHFGTSLPFKKGGVAVAAWRLRRRIEQGAFDLVHVHTEIPELTLAIATKFPGSTSSVPVLRSIHNVELWNGWRGVGLYVERCLNAAAVIAVSNAALNAADALAALVKAPLGSQPIRRVIYNGVIAAPTTTRLSSSSPVKVLFAGRFEQQKGADLLPAILRKAASKVSRKVEVTIAGEGSLHRQIVINLPQFDQLSANVVPPIAGLAQRLADYDILLMPSRFEGLPLTAIEALLAGLPVVATQAPGLIEVVPAKDPLSSAVDDVEQIGSCLAEAVNRLLDEKARIIAMKDDLSHKFGACNMAKAYLVVYKRIMSLQ